jgi:hypothetical protein
VRKMAQQAKLNIQHPEVLSLEVLKSISHFFNNNIKHLQNFIQMKKYLKSLILLTSMMHFACIAAKHTPIHDPIQIILEEWQLEITNVLVKFDSQSSQLRRELLEINTALQNTTQPLSQLNLLIRKDAVKDQFAQLQNTTYAEVSKIRYLKGLAILKILYEKVLALDHHFAAIATFNEINSLSNPNHYPEFAGVKDLIKQSGNRKTGLELTKLLGDNVYANIATTLVGLFNSEAPREAKQEELAQVDCIMDFTLRMHQDLNTIWFETAFLQKSNAKIKIDLEQLFIEYTKPIGYYTPLPTCRNTDDWDAVQEKLKAYLTTMDTFLNDPAQAVKAHKMQVNLEFPIDRLLQFITQYNAFIDQGGKFYEKFKIILDSYEHATQCQHMLPPAYAQLKADIDLAIEKFNTAYKPVEINGSKMKEILYGINEYE